MLPEQFQRRLRVGLLNVRAVEDVDEFLAGLRSLVRERRKKRGDLTRCSSQRAIAQPEIIARVNIKAVKVRVARGIGDLHGHDAGEAAGHGRFVFARLHCCVEREHGADALRDGLGRDNHDFARSQFRRRLRSHDDVLVVGQDEDDLRRRLFDRVQNILRRGVHGLAALNDLVNTEIAEHAGQARTRAHGDAAVALFGFCRSRLLRRLAFQLLFHSLQIVGRTGLAAGGQIIVLQAHVLDLCKFQRTILLGLAQCVTRNIRMYMDLERFVVLADDETVADAAEILAQRVERGNILALAHNKDRVERECDVLRVENAEIGLFIRCTCVLADNIVAAQAFEHAAQNKAEAHTARINDAGLFKNRILVDGVVQRSVRRVKAVLQHILDLIVFLGQIARGVCREAGDG